MIYVNAISSLPDDLAKKDELYSEFIPPMAARRMGPSLKDSIVTSVLALRDSGISMPDAIVVGTGLGCINNTEKFLKEMIDNRERMLQPTAFINSTHNSIAAQTAVYLKCHSYNCTYSHNGISFESALLDAVMQLELGRIHTALVGAQDEFLPDGHCAVTFALSDQENSSTLCAVEDVTVFRTVDDSYFGGRLDAFLERNALDLSQIDRIFSDSRLPDGIPFTPITCRRTLTSPAIALETACRELAGQNSSDGSKTWLTINTFDNRDMSFILIRK